MKSCFAFSISLSFLLHLLSVYPPSSESAPNYLWHYCPNTTLFASNSTYQSNLDTLLSSLSSAAAADNNTDGFANATAGQNPPDVAYGLFLCRGDLSAAMCSDCVATGTQDILRRCPNRRLSAIWYDECMLRYSNQSIFSVMEELPALTMYNDWNITDSAKLVQVLGAAIKDVGWRASVGEFGKKVAVGEASFSLRTLFTLAQCTPDLMAWDCNTCLRSVIPGLPEGKSGGRIFTPSCTVRIELYPFYNSSALLAPPPAPVTTSEGPLPPPVTTPKGKSNKSAVITIAIIAPVGGVMVLLLLTCGLLRRKGKKTYEVVNDQSGANELTTVESLQFTWLQYKLRQMISLMKKS